MHEKFYINDELKQLEEINQVFSTGEEIKRFLKANQVECGYSPDCKAELRPYIMSKTKVVYLRSIQKRDHLENCPFHNLARLKQRLIRNGTLDFLIKNWSQEIKNAPKIKSNELIARQHDGVDLKLCELFDLLKNDPELTFLKEKSFIDPENCDLWYEKNHGSFNNAVLLTGTLNRKLFSCYLCSGNSNYDCENGHSPRDFKLEIMEKDIEFHISVSKEIYDSIILDSLDDFKKSYHILAKINKMNGSDKRFYTKNGKTINHVVKNKKFIELIKNEKL